MKMIISLYSNYLELSFFNIPEIHILFTLILIMLWARPRIIKHHFRFKDEKTLIVYISFLKMMSK